MMNTPFLTNKVTLIKLAIHAASIGSLVWLILSAVNGHLGAEPVDAIIHFTGKSTLHVLFVTLLITPVVRCFKWGQLIRVRRLVGLYCFFWASLHLLSYAWLDLAWDVSLLVEEITTRNYLILGMLSWILLLLLSITSVNLLRRKLGSSWQKLHNWIYVIAILGPIHYYWSSKSEILEPSLYLLVAVILLIARKNKIERWLFR